MYKYDNLRILLDTQLVFKLCKPTYKDKLPTMYNSSRLALLDFLFVPIPNACCLPVLVKTGNYTE